MIEKTVAENPGNPDALLRLTAIDPACGSGHFILGAARRIAQRLADLRNPGAASIAEYRHALREVVSHCIYGVDQNELAVELCRVALWIEAVEPGMPLSFLDAKIRHGNSLVGISDFSMLSKGIPDDAYAALDGDDKDACKFYRSLNRAQREGSKKSGRQNQFSFAAAPPELADAVLVLDSMPENTVEDVRAKQQALEAIKDGPLWQRLSVACDLFVAAFFAKKDGPVWSRRSTIARRNTSPDAAAPRSGANLSSVRRRSALPRSGASTKRIFHLAPATNGDVSDWASVT
ncbi:hypothetical protein [Bradyrhizobium betae]|uniref:site-specific DNA-methyltransferase (adenine-specific) n=1 Tax=Bradyrhizobium betae TaxID=244734 RepID=A0A5P6P8N1_9BRAD|nr:hypothetical protein [Bradyrhizobium betae]QFI74747.1 hypothetical protein F8237_21450 [Bradyrhizobium betae]